MVDRIIDGKRCYALKLVEDIDESDARKYLAALKERSRDYCSLSGIMDRYGLDSKVREDCEMVLSSLEEKLANKGSEPTKPALQESIIKKQVKEVCSNIHKNFYLKYKTTCITLGIIGALYGVYRGGRELLEDNSVGIYGDSIHISEAYGFLGREAEFTYLRHNWRVISFDNVRLVDSDGDNRVNTIYLDGAELDDDYRLFLEADKAWKKYCEILGCDEFSLNEHLLENLKE